jgi:hypothetical protein
MIRCGFVTNLRLKMLRQCEVLAWASLIVHVRDASGALNTAVTGNGRRSQMAAILRDV